MSSVICYSISVAVRSEAIATPVLHWVIAVNAAINQLYESNFQHTLPNGIVGAEISEDGPVESLGNHFPAKQIQSDLSISFWMIWQTPVYPVFM